MFVLLTLYLNGKNTGIFDGHCHSSGDYLSFFYKDFSAVRIYYVLCSNGIHKSVVNSQLLVILVSSYLCQIIALRIKEKCVEHGLGILNCRRLTRSQSSVDFSESVISVLGTILLEGAHQSRVISEYIQDVLICAETKSSQECSDRQLSLSVNSGVKYAVGICFILQPGSPVRDYLCRIKALIGFIHFNAKIRSWRTNQLCNNGSLRTVINKRAFFCHQRELAHEHVLLHNGACLHVLEPYLDS